MNSKLSNKEAAVYIHIPFCDHKCIYCDFYSIVSYENKSNYLNSLLKEIDYFANQYKEKYSIETIYFGGGTPSFVEPNYIEKILNHLDKYFSISDKVEITLETNPGTVDKEKLKSFKQIGINRISIGIQSFDDNELKFLTRIHNKETAIQTVNLANESGFENISIDLIFNLPKQTKERWFNNLQTAVKLPIKHISAYSLILERGTILNKMVLDGKVKIQDEDYDAQLYEITIDFLLNNNFIQYEVSNFAKNGFECKHNNAYWRYKDYLSFGTSAHSFVNGIRWWNYSSLNFYIDAINKKGNAIIGKEILSDEQIFEEYVMLALRSKGIDKEEFKRLFGYNWFKKNETKIGEYIKNNYLTDDKYYLKCTSKGYAVCDEIIKNLI